MLKNLINYGSCCYLGLRAKKAKGQALVEYAIIIAIVAVFLVTALTSLRGGIVNTFNNIISKL